MKKIPLVDLKAQYAAHRAGIDAAIARVLENTAFVGGREVADFEAAFAEFTGAAHAIGCGNGTDALALALKALGVGPGDEVVVPAMTFIATAEAVEMVGATPVFCDADADTLLMTAASVEPVLTARTKAVIPVHLYGQPVQMGPLMELARSRGLQVVEDCAQAHGATIGGAPVGSFGALACYSFYPGKNLGAYGDGGAVTTNDDALADWVRRAKDHGRQTKYTHEFAGVNSRLDGLQAAVLGAKLPHLSAWTEARRSVAALYDEALRGAPVNPVAQHGDARSVYHLYVVRVAERDRVLAGLRERGVMAGVHYPVPLHQQPAYADRPHAPLPNSEAAAPEILSLPLYPELAHADARRVVDALLEVV